MILRLNKYVFYLRLMTYFLPTLAFAFGFYSRFFSRSDRSYDPNDYCYVLLLMTIIWGLVASHYKLCTLELLFRENTGLRATLKACGATFSIIALLLFLLHELVVSRLFMVVTAAALVVLTIGLRIVFRRVLNAWYPRTHAVRILMVGSDRFAQRVAARIRRSPLMRTCVVGYVHVPGQKVSVRDARVWELDKLAAIDADDFEDILIAVPPEYFRRIPAIVAQLERYHRPIRAVVDLGGRLVIRENLFQIGPLQLLDLASNPTESVEYLVLKRAFDIAFALIALVVTSPLLATVALAVKLTSSGPVLFRQDRVGLNGKQFKMLKFRSMFVNANSAIAHTKHGDPRITPVGRLLRKTSLDELPQFINVLKGDMSVVGPRPELTHFVQKFRREIPSYMARHNMKCGITGWAQVNGWRGETSIRKRVECDLYYLQNWSFAFDLRIILTTLWAGFVHRNAY